MLFHVMSQTALELLANFCVLARERGASPQTHRPSLDSTTSTGGMLSNGSSSGSSGIGNGAAAADWAGMDEEEGERLMDAIAAAAQGNTSTNTSSGNSNIMTGTSANTASAYASLLLSVSAASRCASTITSLLGLVEQFKVLAAAASTSSNSTAELLQQPYAVPSTSK